MENKLEDDIFAESVLENYPDMVTAYYKVGPDELDPDELKDIYGVFDWVVYWYQINGDSGDGVAVGFEYETGYYHIMRLKHNQGYGPTEYWVTDAYKMLGESEVYHHLMFDFEFDRDSIFAEQEENCRSSITSVLKEILG